MRIYYVTVTRTTTYKIDDAESRDEAEEIALGAGAGNYSIVDENTVLVSSEEKEVNCN